jgi:hypothetical protein
MKADYHIEKTYHDNKSGEPDVLFNSFDELRTFYTSRDEAPAWVNAFIDQLKTTGEAFDRFAAYKVVEV